MSSRQQRDRRAEPSDPRSQTQQSSNRQNEYFVPRDGIDREVITADICRYLGNDALVRPGTYVDSNGQTIQGYYINAYRNLTSAMIMDLKADSARWEAERRGNPSSGGNVRYENSVTVQQRQQQQYGATSDYNSMRPSYAGAAPTGYPAGTSSLPSQAYNTGSTGPYGAYSQVQTSHYQYAGQPAAAGYQASPVTHQPYAATTGPAWDTGASMKYQTNTRSDFDVPMGDAPQSRPPVYPGNANPMAQGYGGQSSGYSYTPVSAPSTTYPIQPTDAFFGRGGVYPPTTSAAFSDSLGSPGGNTIPYGTLDHQYEDPNPPAIPPVASPSPGQNIGGGNPSRRGDRDNDRSHERDTHRRGGDRGSDRHPERDDTRGTRKGYHSSR